MIMVSLSVDLHVNISKQRTMNNVAFSSANVIIPYEVKTISLSC